MRLISRNREAATGELHAVRRNHDHVRKDSPDHQKARGGDGQFARTECGSTARLLARSRCEPSRVPVKGSATALPHTRQTCATSFNHPHDAVHTTLSQLFNFLHAAPTARFRRVVLTARQSLPVYPDKQTISAPIGTSRANFGRAPDFFISKIPSRSNQRTE